MPKETKATVKQTLGQAKRRGLQQSQFKNQRKLTIKVRTLQLKQN